MRAVGHAAVALDEPPVIEVVPGSYDLPGARLLDLVAVMDRLRADARGTASRPTSRWCRTCSKRPTRCWRPSRRATTPALREELGDLLLQVAFHARVAQERPDGFDIDDVAEGIVDKLVRRHPHVFGRCEVDGADEVSDNWEAIKAAERAAKGERARCSDGVPMGQPALSLAAQLLRRAERAGAPDALPAETRRGVGRASCSSSYGRPRRRGSTPRPSSAPPPAPTATGSRTGAWAANARRVDPAGVTTAVPTGDARPYRW